MHGVILLFLLSTAVVQSFIHLTEQNVTDFVENNGGLIIYYSPWCSRSKELIHTQISSLFDGEVEVGLVNCADYTMFCSCNDIVGYPTLKFYRKGVHAGHRFNGSSYTTFEVRKFLQSLHPTMVQELSDIPSIRPAFILFYVTWCSHCHRMLPIWKRLAFNRPSALKLIGKVNCEKNAALCRQYLVKAYPTMIWLELDHWIVYGGTHTLSGLQTFVEETIDDGMNQNAGKKISFLDGSNFQQFIDDDKFTFVKFCISSSEECVLSNKVWEELSDTLVMGSLQYGEVECLQSSELCAKLGIMLFPTVIVFKRGKRINFYSGPFELAKLKKFVYNNVMYKQIGL